MTPEEWSRLRLEWLRRMDPWLGRYALAPDIIPPFVPPRAGDWFRTSGHAIWHRFSGDLDWFPSSVGWPGLISACGTFRTGAIMPLHPVSVVIRKPRTDACRRCAGSRS